MSAPIMDNCCGCEGLDPQYGLNDLRTIKALHRWEGYIPWHAGCLGEWQQTGVAPHLEWNEEEQRFDIVGYVAPSLDGMDEATSAVLDDNEAVRYHQIVIETKADVQDDPVWEENSPLRHVECVVEAMIDARDGATMAYSETYDPNPVPYYYAGGWGGKTSSEINLTDFSDRTSGAARPSQISSAIPIDGCLVSWSVKRTRTSEEITYTRWIQLHWNVMTTATYYVKRTLSTAYTVEAALGAAASMANEIAWGEVPRRHGVLVQWVGGTGGLAKTRTIGGWDAGDGMATLQVGVAGVTAGKSLIDDPHHFLCDVIGTGQELMEPSSTLPLPGDGHGAQDVTPSSTIYDVLEGGKYEFSWSWVPTATGYTYGHANYGTCGP